MKMKYLWAVMLLLVVLQNKCFTQNDNVKYDKHCMFGIKQYGNSIMSVELDTYSIKKRPTLSFNTSSSIMADRNGELQYYSNGISINNKIHYNMKNGQRINPGKYLGTSAWTDPQTGGLPVFMGLLSLPSPNKDDQYYLFNTDLNVKRYTNPTNLWVIAPEFYYQKIDMSKDNGFGEVVELNQLITGDTLESGQLTACRHGNGRDWWLLVNEYRYNTYRSYLLNETGVSLQGKQTLHDVTITEFNNMRIPVFTPNGKHLIRVDHDSIPTVYIMEFDRCQGQIGKIISFKLNVTGIFTCAAVSSNSRFLYVIQQEKIMQFDLWAEDIKASIETVAEFDGFSSPYNDCLTRFFQAWLAPDGKIYLATGPCGSYHLHVIDYPNEKGMGCNVRQHAVDLTVLNAYTVPNFPNYRLGTLKGSPCDTLTVSTKELPQEKFGLKVLPNPASDRIQIEVNLPNYDPNPAGASLSELVIVNANGSVVQRYTMPEFAYMATLDVSTLESGVYGLQLRQRDRVLAVEKLVVVR